MASNPKWHSCMKHIDLHYHFIWDIMNNTMVKLKYYPTEIITVNFLTKILRKFKHTTCRKLLGLKETGAQN
jgi:hypothetical protein